MPKYKYYPFLSHVSFGRGLDGLPKVSVLDPFFGVLAKIHRFRVFSAKTVKITLLTRVILAKMTEMHPFETPFSFGPILLEK